MRRRICVPAARLRHGSAGWSPARFACPYRRARRAVAGRVVDPWRQLSTRPDRRRRPAIRARPSGELARYALTGPLEGFDAVLLEVNFAPGVSAREHRHPGFILGYVVDGQMRFGINHEAGQVVPAGGTFFEPHGALHTSFGSASPMRPCAAWCSWWSPTAAR